MTEKHLLLLNEQENQSDKSAVAVIKYGEVVKAIERFLLLGEFVIGGPTLCFLKHCANISGVYMNHS